MSGPLENPCRAVDQKQFRGGPAPGGAGPSDRGHAVRACRPRGKAGEATRDVPTPLHIFVIF